MNIIFFGNSDFSVAPLRALIEQFNVIAVVTAPDSTVGRGHHQSRKNPVKIVAEEHNIPILQPQRLKNNTEFFQVLKDLQADIHVIVSYGKILPKEMIDIPHYQTINLHASLLPELRGAAPIQYALWKGLEKTGNTVQFITEKMDEGDIINQSKVDILLNDDYLSLEQKLTIDGAKLLVESINLLQQENFKAIPQDHEKATYTSLIHKDDGLVHFSMSAEDIVNSLRAFRYKPGIQLSSSFGNIKILDCSLGSQESSGNEGEIIAFQDNGMLVACAEGTILLKMLQAPNKKPLSGRDFANGCRLKIGSLLK